MQTTGRRVRAVSGEKGSEPQKRGARSDVGPFISYGGSNLVIMMGCVGLLINIGRHAGDRLPVSASLADLEEFATPQNS